MITGKENSVKLIVFSICKDEAETIGELLDRVPSQIKGIDTIEKLVISDGSGDDTVAIAKKHGADVIEGKTQKRLAYRFQQAVHLALERGADIAVGIDGDLQFKPEDIPILVESIVNGDAEFVSANRFINPDTGEQRMPDNMPSGKYWANRLGAWVVSKLTRQEFPDVTCGFRAYSRRALLALNLNSKYTYTQESFQVLAMRQLSIVTIPIEVKYYPGRKSRVVTSFSQFLFGSALNILRAFRDFAPLRFFGIAGLTPVLFGSALGVFVVQHWAFTGSITPYKAIGFIGIYLLSIGLVLWALGLVADMLDRLLKNQEKIIEEQKRSRYDREDKSV